MDAFFNSVQQYIDAVKAKATDLAEKGAKALEELATWLRSQTNAALIGGGPTIDTTRLAALHTECQALIATPTKVGTTPVGSHFGDLIAKLIAAILAALK